MLVNEFAHLSVFRPQVIKSLSRFFCLSVHNPTASFSSLLGNSFRQTIAAKFSDSRMNESVMLSGHLQASLRRAETAGGNYLLIAQDTTYYNYHGHKKMDGLGRMCSGVSGILQHNTLLMDELGHPLGVIHQKNWTRGGNKDFSESDKQVKESNKWVEGLAAVNEHLAQLPQTKVLIQDRESDVLSFFKAARVPGVALLVRAHQPRNMRVLASDKLVKLAQAAEHLADLGSWQTALVQDGREQTLHLQLRAGAVTIYPDKDLSPRLHAAKGLSLVVAQEVARTDPHTGNRIEIAPKDAVLWYLLTSLPIETPEQVQRIVQFYALRWRIERLHYTLKSGALNVEKLQFDDIHTTCNALAFYTIVAWQLLAITYAVRQDAEQPPQQVFDDTDIAILTQISQQPITNTRQAVLVLGKLVGFAPSKKIPMPGIKVLAKAIEKLYFIKIGFGLTKPLQD